MNSTSSEVDDVLVKTCKKIELHFDINILEVGMDKDHIHFSVQSVPSVLITKFIH
jgi:putative transposase